MNNIDAMNAARLDKALNRKYNFANGGIMTLRQFLDTHKPVKFTSATRARERHKRNGCYNEIKPVTEYTIWYGDGTYGIGVPKMVYDHYRQREPEPGPAKRQFTPMDALNALLDGLNRDPFLTDPDPAWVQECKDILAEAESATPENALEMLDVLTSAIDIPDPRILDDHGLWGWDIAVRLLAENRKAKWEETNADRPNTR